jgi:hypothetical protein
MYMSAYRAELIDALHFLLNLMLAGDMTGRMVTDMYHKKRKMNAQRWHDGYTGVKKCPMCKRSYDDPSTECFISTNEDKPQIFCVELVNALGD